jgi:hypothetical protein
VRRECGLKNNSLSFETDTDIDFYCMEAMMVLLFLERGSLVVFACCFSLVFQARSEDLPGMRLVVCFRFGASRVAD